MEGGLDGRRDGRRGEVGKERGRGGSNELRERGGEAVGGGEGDFLNE